MAAGLRPQVSVGLGYRYDSVYLRDGSVPMRGFDVVYEPQIDAPAGPPAGGRAVAGGGSYVAPAPIFAAMATDPPYDVGELAFATFVQAVDHGTPILGIPVFTSRYFEHNQLFARAGSGIESPIDLEGKRVSIACWGVNPAVWLRGVLTHQYDISTERITWLTSRGEYFDDYAPPRRYAVERLSEGESVQRLLEKGGLDAVSRGRASELVRPLFADPYPEIRRYFELTGVFPPNTVLAIRRDSLERHSDLAEALLEAFSQALDRYRDAVADGTREAEHSGLDLRLLEERYGVPLPRYGFAANRAGIRTMIAYCYEQGVIRRLHAPEDLFVLTNS